MGKYGQHRRVIYSVSQLPLPALIATELPDLDHAPIIGTSSETARIRCSKRRSKSFIQCHTGSLWQIKI